MNPFTRISKRNPGLTNEALRDALEYSHVDSIYKLKRGENLPALWRIQKLADLAEMTPGSVVNWFAKQQARRRAS